MGLFNNLMSKIFGTASSAAASQPSSAPASAGSGGATVDVAAVLDGLAAKNPEKLDWKHSIVDLMKLVAQTTCRGAAIQRRSERFRFNECLAAQGSAEEAVRERWKGSSGTTQMMSVAGGVIGLTHPNVAIALLIFHVV
jgi:hypothetical protein